jgi:hypothetical protein
MIMSEQTISKTQAKRLKPYLKYMDFVDVRAERFFLVEKIMYENMYLGNIKTSFIDELRSNYIKKHPESQVPEVLKRA